MKQETILPKAPVARILFNAGAKRVSNSATNALIEVLEQYSEDLAGKAVQIAKHSGRKTVQDSDIKLAAK
ncbi:MAG: histone family protein [Nanoarchaeota archaeon]|nr:histone family protein [Nanoarchaeota archaeon]